MQLQQNINQSLIDVCINDPAQAMLENKKIATGILSLYNFLTKLNI